MTQDVGERPADYDDAIPDDPGEFCRRYRTRVLRYVRTHYPRPRHAVEDITQETMIKACLKLRSPDRDGHLTLGYVYRIADNVAHDQWRQSRARAAREIRAVCPAPTDEPDENMLLQADYATARQALRMLSERDRSALTLRHMCDMNTDEYAGFCGITPTAAEKRVQRAHGRFETYFRRLCGVFAPVIALAEGARQLAKALTPTTATVTATATIVAVSLSPPGLATDTGPASAAAPLASAPSSSAPERVVPATSPTTAASPPPAKPMPAPSVAPPTRGEEPTVAGEPAAHDAGPEVGVRGSANVNADPGPGEKESHDVEGPQTPLGRSVLDGETYTTTSLVPAACTEAVAACRDADNNEAATVQIDADG